METIIGINKENFSKTLKFQKILTAAISVAALILNILFISFRNDANHTVMYVLTVVIDVMYAWFMIAFIEIVILPKSRLLSLYEGCSSRYQGKVISVSENTVKMRKTDCYEVIFCEEEHRKLFLPDTLTLSAGDTVTVGINSGVIVEVYDE